MMYRPISAKRRDVGKQRGVTAEHPADSTSKQFARPQKKHYPVHKRTAENQLLDSSDDDTDLLIQNAEPAAVKNESETVKWNKGKAPSGKLEIQNSGQPAARTN